MPDLLVYLIFRVLRVVAVVVELKFRVDQELVRQLLVGHSRKRRAKVRGVLTRRLNNPAIVELAQLRLSGNLRKLRAQPPNLRAKFHVELRLRVLVGWKVALRLVQRHQSVLDARHELDLVGDLPRPEVTQELKQQRRKFLGERIGYVPKRRTTRGKLAHDRLKRHNHRRRRVEQSLLERTHRLEDVRRKIRNHVGSEEHPNVDVFRRNRHGRRSMPESAEKVDALQAGLGCRDDRPFPEEDNEVIKSAATTVRSSKPRRTNGPLTAWT